MSDMRQRFILIGKTSNIGGRRATGDGRQFQEVDRGHGSGNLAKAEIRRVSVLSKDLRGHVVFGIRTVVCEIDGYLCLFGEQDSTAIGIVVQKSGGLPFNRRGFDGKDDFCG